MAESVSEILGRLQFVSRPMEALYLNQTRIHDNFYGQLGAIESFSRAVTREGGFETPIVKIGANAAAEASVSWTLSDPIAQALVLRSALESQNLISDVDNAKPGSYVVLAGTGLASRPGMFDDLHRDGLGRRPGLYEALEAERAKQESIARLIEDLDKHLWLLTVIDKHSTCAAFLDSNWLRPPFSHWINPDYAVTPWEIFGICRRIHHTGIPLVATLCVTVKW